MSRIGRKPVPVPAGVTVAVEGGQVSVKGSLGQLALSVHPAVAVKVEAPGGAIVVSPATGSGRAPRETRALHGLTRSLIANMVEGVSKGFQKRLIINGTGYSAKLEGTTLVLALGFAQPVRRPAPPGIKLEVPNPTTIVIKGCDKQQVGQFAAEVRDIYPPEPYKQKGIRYENEVVRKKAGKTFVGGAAT